MNATSPAQSVISPPSVLLTMHERLASQSATCKLVGLVLSALALAFVSGKSSTYLFLPLMPLLSALLLDAAYAARARHVLQLMRRLAGGESKSTVSPWEMIGTLMAPQGLHAALPSLGGVLLLSVWPFYLTLGLFITFLGAQVLAPKPLPVLPRNPVVSGDLVAGSNINKYPASVPQPPRQFQGVRPPQTQPLGPQVINGSSQPAPGTPKGGPVFSVRPPQPVKSSPSISLPPGPKQPAGPGPVTPAPKPSAESLSATPAPAAPAPAAPAPAAPATVPKLTSSPSSAPPASTPSPSKPDTTAGNGGVKQP